MNKQPTQAQVKRYMRSVASEYVDTGGEYVATWIAEDAIDRFDLDGSENAPVWDWAVEVVEALDHYHDLTGERYNHDRTN